MHPARQRSSRMPAAAGETVITLFTASAGGEFLCEKIITTDSNPIYSFISWSNVKRGKLRRARRTGRENANRGDAARRQSFRAHGNEPCLRAGRGESRSQRTTYRSMSGLRHFDGRHRSSAFGAGSLSDVRTAIASAQAIQQLPAHSAPRRRRHGFRLQSRRPQSQSKRCAQDSQEGMQCKRGRARQAREGGPNHSLNQPPACGQSVFVR